MLPFTLLAAPLLLTYAAPAVTALSIVEANIADLQDAMSHGRINAVQLAAKHLNRVAQYDRRGPRLNAIPVLNLDIFEHAQASDDYRSQNGSVRSQLDGIPGTIKDSYMMAGMTVASGSPAFVNLTASEDAFTTGRLRESGALILGKTTMPPMANGGMQRGVYGRAESPYNKDFLTAAFASGSSNGAASSTAASMAVFAMAEETVSSGRSPASNNGLVAYTPSRGVLSIRGNWPLFPVADVVVPYARTVEDMFTLLDVLVVDDELEAGDFWRGQPFVELPSASSVRPIASYHSFADTNALAGKRIGVPKMYIGEEDPDAQPVWVSPQVRELWDQARLTLEGLGAVVEEVSFPLVTKYETPGEAPWETDYPLPAGIDSPDLAMIPDLHPYAWDDFLKRVNDVTVSGLTSLADVDPALIFPQLPGTLQDRYGNRLGNRTAINTGAVESVIGRNSSIYELPGLETLLNAVEAWRAEHLEQWMDDNSLDLLVWPAVGDVGREDAETNETSSLHAWRNGVFFSHGNYAIRQFGVPTVGVSMGLLSDSQMPVDLTFASKAYDDNALLRYGYAFEQAHEQRVAPPLTPTLPSDFIAEQESSGSCRAGVPWVNTTPPQLEASAVKTETSTGNSIEISGTVDATDSEGIRSVEVFVDGVQVGGVQVGCDGTWKVMANVIPYDDAEGDVPVRVVNVPDQSLAMIVVVATAKNGRSDGKLLFV